MKFLRSCRAGLGAKVAACIVAITAVCGIQPPTGIAATRVALPARLGTLSSPSLGQPITVFGGVPAASTTLIKASSLDVPGAVHVPQSASPGQLGVAVIAAHRTTWPRPFYRLDKIPIGELITFTDNAGAVTAYRVVRTGVVRNDAAAFATVMNNEVRFGSDTRLTLYACSRANGRPTSAKYRYIVEAVKVVS